MAIAVDHRSVRRAAGTRHSGTLSYLVRDVSERIVSAWQRHRAERELESMSFDQRKDIGFRASDKITR